jgi:uncharacterized membrane protein YuzA (DUF378 family)
MIDDKSVLQLLSFVVAVAALNWALVAFFDYHLVVDLLGFAEGTTEYKAVVGVIGAAAGIRLYETVGWAISGGE